MPKKTKETAKTLQFRTYFHDSLEKLMEGSDISLRSSNAVDAYQEMTESLLDLDRMLDHYCTPDEDGDYPAVNEETQQRLMKAYSRALNKTEQFRKLTSLKKPEDYDTNPQSRSKYDHNLVYEPETPFSSAALYIIRDLTVDLSAIANADFKTNPSLGDAIRAGRTISIKLPENTGKDNLKRINSPAGVRYQIRYTENGEEKTGYFTQSRRINFRGNIEKRLQAVIRKYEDNDQVRIFIHDYMFRTFTSGLSNQAIAQKMAHGILLAEKEDTLKYLNSGTEVNEDLDEELRNCNLEGLSDIFRKDRKTGMDVLRALSENAREAADETKRYEEVLVCSTDSFINGRASAASAAASFLGLSRLTLISKPALLTSADGRIINGSIMEKTKGCTIAENSGQLASLNAEGKHLENSAYVDALAVQVLDYICLNPDRHQNSISYLLNKDGTKVAGLQMIENEYSFGLQTDIEEIKETGLVNPHIPVPGVNLRYIPKSVADAVMGADPGMMFIALCGNGLSDDEMKAACERLDLLKNMISDQTVTVIEDAEINGREYEQADLKGLASPYENLENVRNYALDKAAEAEVNDAPEDQGIKAFDENRAVLHALLEKEAEKADTLLTSVDNADRHVTHGSLQYAEMKESVHNLKESLIACENASAQNKRTACISLFRQYTKVFSDAQRYLDTKSRYYPNFLRSPRENARIRAAHEILNCRNAVQNVIEKMDMISGVKIAKGTLEEKLNRTIESMRHDIPAAPSSSQELFNSRLELAESLKDLALKHELSEEEQAEAGRMMQELVENNWKYNAKVMRLNAEKTAEETAKLKETEAYGVLGENVTPKNISTFLVRNEAKEIADDFRKAVMHREAEKAAAVQKATAVLK